MLELFDAIVTSCDKYQAMDIVLRARKLAAEDLDVETQIYFTLIENYFNNNFGK